MSLSWSLAVPTPGAGDASLSLGAREKKPRLTQFLTSIRSRSWTSSQPVSQSRRWRPHIRPWTHAREGGHRVFHCDLVDLRAGDGVGEDELYEALAVACAPRRPSARRCCVAGQTLPMAIHCHPATCPHRDGRTLALKGREDEGLADPACFMLARLAVRRLAAERVEELEHRDKAHRREPTRLRPLVDDVDYPARVGHVDGGRSCS